MNEYLPLGKLDSKLLQEVLSDFHGLKDPDVILPPAEGEDAAVVRIQPQHHLVVATDPITFPTERPGWYAVQINANDVATRGASPRWFLSTLLFPEGKTTPETIKNTFSQVSEACNELGVSVIGGHTEITYGIDRTIVNGVMMGLVEEGREVKTGNAQTHDMIIMTKRAAVEGTSIIASEKYDELREKGYSHEFLTHCKDFIYHPGISVVKEALIAHRIGVHSMHDPTEGGIANGLAEIAQASKKGLIIYRNMLPIFDETQQLCAEYDMDPLGTIASGSLLMTTSIHNALPIIEELHKHNIEANIIGNMLPQDEGLHIADNPHTKKKEELRYSATDEITKLFN